ncbi:hypothetical protein L596_014811 [Steinernema carpocapsae]|uniref:Uncharacterized protein n=1 Tax=Steinernema carpocapsae TaxID=34508 RepID=A0A4U5NDY4_STECR|nr:hypothetical protein L596_014811 [Steinernema carpocapsae]
MENVNNKINMSLDDIIKLKRANEKAGKKDAAAKKPRGRGNTKFVPKKETQSPRKGGNAKRGIQKADKKPRAPARANKQQGKGKPLKATFQKQAQGALLNKAATKKLVNNLVKKALKTTRAAKKVAPVRGRPAVAPTRVVRKRITAPVAARSNISSRLNRVSNQSRVIRRRVRVVEDPQARRQFVVRGRGAPRFRQEIQVPQRPVNAKRRKAALNRLMGWMIPTVSWSVPSSSAVSVSWLRLATTSKSSSGVPVQRQRTVQTYERPVQRFQQQRPVQQRVVYVEQPRPQPQRVIVRSVERGGRFAPRNAYSSEVVVRRRGRGFNSARY